VSCGVRAIPSTGPRDSFHATKQTSSLLWFSNNLCEHGVQPQAFG